LLPTHATQSRQHYRLNAEKKQIGAIGSRNRNTLGEKGVNIAKI